MLFLATALSFSVSSCGNDDEETVDYEKEYRENTVAEKEMLSLILGDWMPDVEVSGYNNYWSFKDNGVAVYYKYFNGKICETRYYTFRIYSDKLNLYDDNGNREGYLPIISLTKESLIFGYSPYLYLYTEKYKKVSSSGGSSSSVSDYPTLIVGHWTDSPTSSVSSWDTQDFQFDYLGKKGDVYFMWSVKNSSTDSGLDARGTYTINGSTLTVKYSYVSIFKYVDGEMVDASSLGDFRSGKSITLTYTIESCDGKTLVLKDKDGKTRTLRKSE